MKPQRCGTHVMALNNMLGPRDNTRNVDINCGKTYNFVVSYCRNYNILSEMPNDY